MIMKIRWTEVCEHIKCGVWKDESHNIVGRTVLTLPTEWGLILIAFFTLWIKFSSGSLWGTVRYILHQINASSGSKDDLYHQMQLSLRNTESESTFIDSLIKIGWAHQGARFQAYRRSFSLILLAAIYGITFGIAGGLSSRFLAAYDTGVLSVTKNCGWLEPSREFNLSKPEDLIAANALTITVRNQYRMSATYSHSCYGGTGANSTQCMSLIQPTLQYKSARALPCPFAEQVCNGSAVSFDTGYIQSDSHLGINTSPENSIAVRKVLKCAPLAGEKYTNGWQPVPLERIKQTPYNDKLMWRAYDFGYGGVEPDFSTENRTLIIDNAAQLGEIPFKILWFASFLDIPLERVWESSPFLPIPELQNSTVDTTLIGISNRIAYATPVRDPLFLADECNPNPAATNGSRRNVATMDVICQAPNPVSFIGCQEQYSFCKESSSLCTPLTGLYPLAPANPTSSKTTNHTYVTDLQLNPVQAALHRLIWNTLWTTQLNFQLGFVGLENLVAQEYLWDAGFGFRISAHLPDNHWEAEVGNWMNTTLAAIQRGVSTFSRPVTFDKRLGNSSVSSITTPTDPEVRQLCNRIKIRNTSQTSFSVFALALTIGIGLLCILSDLYLSRFVALIQRRTGRGDHKRLAWIEDSTLQLQRMAAEGRGVGPWAGKEDDVPRLEQREQLFNLTALRLEERGGDGQRYRVVRQRVSSEDDRVESQRVTPSPKVMGGF